MLQQQTSGSCHVGAERYHLAHTMIESVVALQQADLRYLFGAVFAGV